MIVLVDGYSFMVSFTCTLVPTHSEVGRCLIWAHGRCLIWAVSPVCSMEDKGKELSSPHFISEVPLGGDDELVLTSFVYIVCLDVVCCYGWSLASVLLS